MIRGSVQPYGQAQSTGKPLIRIEVASAVTPGTVLSVEFLVDTGFTGHLMLTPALVRELELPYTRNRLVRLADGSTRNLALSVAQVDWDGQKQTVPVLESESQPLLGMAMLWGKRITIDAWADGDVTIS